MKSCSWCQQKKPLSEFYKIRNKSHSQCKVCVIQQSRHTRNPSKYPLAKRERRKTKRCPICKIEKPFSYFSPRKRKDTIDGISSYCKDCCTKIARVRNITHPQKRYPSSSTQNKVNLATRRARKTKAGGSFTISEWEELKAFHNFTCLCCKKIEPIISLTADHVIPISKGGKSNISNIQPLCKSCNCKKYTSIIDYR